MYEIFSESICLSWFAMLPEIWAPAKLHSRIKQRIKQLVFFMHHTLIPCRVQLLKSIVISYFHFNLQRKCGTPHSFNWRFWQNPNKKNEWNSTPMYDTSRLWDAAPKGVPLRHGLIHKKRVLFVGSLFVGKLSDFQLRTAWSHISYFTPNHSDHAKLTKTLVHSKQHSGFFAYSFLPFGLSCS